MALRKDKSKILKREAADLLVYILKNSYTLCVYKNGKWVEASEEIKEEVEVFENIKDQKRINEYLSKVSIPKNLPASIQWEKAAIKIITALGNEAEYDYFVTFDHKIKEFVPSWENIYKYPDVNKEPVNLTIMKEKLSNNEYFS